MQYLSAPAVNLHCDEKGHADIGVSTAMVATGTWKSLSVR